MEYTWLMWYRYLANGADLTSISTFEEQDSLIELACLIVGAAVNDILVSDVRLFSSSAISGDGED